MSGVIVVGSANLDLVYRVHALPAPGETVLALENAAGHGGTIGRDFLELGTVLRAVGAPRLQVCVDTCHAFAGGYNLADRDGVQAMHDKLIAAGLELLRLDISTDLPVCQLGKELLDGLWQLGQRNIRQGTGFADLQQHTRLPA